MHLLTLLFVTLFVITIGLWDLLSARVGPLPTLALGMLLASAAAASAWLGYLEGRRNGPPRPPAAWNVRDDAKEDSPRPVEGPAADNGRTRTEQQG